MHKKIPQLRDAEWLRSEYSQTSAYRIALELGCDTGRVTDALRRIGVKIRPITDRTPKKLRDQSWLTHQYEKHSMREIAEMLNCTVGAVWHAVRRHGIKARPSGRELGPAQLRDRQWLEERYRQLTTYEIAEELGCHQGTVWRHMKQLGIPLYHAGRRLKISKYKTQKGPDGQSHPQHRLIMEAHLGRKLETNEHVHHEDENKRNNALSNLAVMRNEEHRSLHTRGERNPKAVLTEADVREIRRRYEQGETQPSLGRHFCVCQSTIWHIIHRQAWKHVV